MKKEIKGFIRLVTDKEYDEENISSPFLRKLFSGSKTSVRLLSLCQMIQITIMPNLASRSS